MKMAKLLLIFVVILSILLLSLAACDWEGNGSAPVEGTPQPGGLQGGQLTATYGAGVLHVQLTALANDQSVGNAVNP